MNKRLGLVAILSVLVLGAFAAESGTGKVAVAAGAGVEIGLAGLCVGPVVEVDYKVSDLFKVGGRSGASIGTYQGQDLDLTGAVRGYLSWVYAEIGGSYQLATLPAANADQTKLQASGLMPMGAIGVSIPAGRLNIDVQLGMHITDMVMETNDPVALFFAGAILWSMCSIKPGVFVEYRFE